MTNSENLDEMPHDATFHQGLHSLSEKEIPCKPKIDIMDHLDLTVSNFIAEKG